MDRLTSLGSTVVMADIDITRTLTIGTAVGSGLVAGVLFGFSSFVMRALDRLPAAEAVAAMQSINREAPTPLFMAALLGTGATATALGISALTRLEEPVARLQLAGSALYLAAVVITAVYHVPRNDALASVDARGVAAAAEWARYSGPWTGWNHVRTLAALGGATLLTVAAGLD
jgi:uncharacterized membrane protein